MEHAGKIWMDGKLVEQHDATVHLLTHSLHYGSAVFEGIRVHETEQGPALFRLKEHIERLFFSAEQFGMEVPYSREELAEAALDVVRNNSLLSGYVRPLIFYGGGYLGLEMDKAAVHIAVMMLPWEKYAASRELKVKVSGYRKPAVPGLAIEAKISGYYAVSILALRDAKKEGYDSAILLDHEGNIAEGPIENVFMVKNGVLATPQRGSILPGITRESVIMLAKGMGIEAEERKITIEELKGADEVFLTGTGSEIAGVVQIDGTQIGSGEMGKTTTQLLESYQEILAGKSRKYENWLTYLTE